MFANFSLSCEGVSLMETLARMFEARCYKHSELKELPSPWENQPKPTKLMDVLYAKKDSVYLEVSVVEYRCLA